MVKKPDGLLRCMVYLHGKGTLRLNRTLFGLAAKLNRTGINHEEMKSIMAPCCLTPPPC